MNPAARPGLDQCLGGVLHALDDVLGDVSDGVDVSSAPAWVATSVSRINTPP